MTANIFLVIFLLAMIFWWSTQGFFSALLHLGITIAAGAIALAVWEPLVLTFLIYRMPAYAWTVGLIAPFILALIIIRLAADKLVKGNVHVHGLIGQILGGACGLVSGVLTAGLAIIAFGFLPFGPGGVGGLVPYATSSTGQIIESTPKLWFGVDRMTYNFYSFLSGGAMSPWGGASLAVYAPDLPQQANIIRLRGGVAEHASIVAVPGDVTVEKIVAAPTPVVGLPDGITAALRPRIDQPNFQVLVVDTLWEQNSPGTFDADQTARIPSPQIRLVTEKRQGGRAVIDTIAPSAIAKSDVNGNRVFFSLGSDQVLPHSLGGDKLGWVFLIADDQVPQYLWVRNLRLQLPPDSEWDNTPDGLASMLGQPQEEKTDEGSGTEGTPDGGEGTVGPRDGVVAGNQATDIVLTNQLVTAFSKNGASGLTYHPTDINAVMGGTATVTMKPGGLSKNTRVDQVYAPGHLAMVRLKVDRDTGQSLLGQSMAAAASLGGVFLTDNRGERYAPIAYNLVRPGNAGQVISVDADNPTAFNSARKLPIADMQPGDELYLFFRVRRGVTIEQYEIGSRTFQAVNLDVPTR